MSSRDSLLDRVPRLTRRSTVAGLALAMATRPAAAGAPTVLRLGTSGEFGGFVVYANALVDALAWANPSISVRLVRTQGSAENAALLRDGRIDIGLAFGEVVYPLFAPSNDAGTAPETGLRIVSVAFSNPGLFMVRGDSRLRSIDELKGRPVVWTVRGSAIALQARYVLEPLGLDPDRDFEPIYTERMTDGPGLLLDGRASALWGAGKRWPGFLAVIDDPRGGRFITPDAAESARIVERYRFLHRFDIPAGRYPRQYEPLQTVGSWSYLLAGPQLGDDVGRALAAALHRVERVAPGMAGGHLAESTVKNTLAALPRPDALEEGVAAYFREIGALP